MGIEILDEAKPNDRLRRLTVHADAVPGAELNIHVLLPHDWSPGGGPWPLVTLHHGGLDDSSSWLRHTDITELSRADDVVIAMPDGGRAGGYADWRRGPQWQTFHVHDLHALMRERFQASEIRAVAGVSGGGYGALLSAAAHPGRFRFAAALSGPCTIRTPPAALTLLAATGIAGRVDPFDMWGVPLLHDRHWRAADPLHLAEGLRGTALYLSCGLTGRPGPLDPPAPWSPANLAEPIVRSTIRPFLRRLRALGIPIETHLYRDGTHDWPSWQRELHRVWPRLVRAVTHPA
ncbi:S-formylglutathione hydrolase FrmB [Actinocorallia herbida]|uniref:S-formylglutathione hydrolase FrmB n=1 Tax=Actinocorallia herbida TaxID=58109 RepID=A0A3N1CXP9_9ACTN|nr:alpha/beta hydrolase family protein [Actinocorallia herbida]ROO86073.1 S-formylglutathione hydrolase FrmB [Actinocorallia herbida]